MIEIAVRHDPTFSRQNTWLIVDNALCARFVIGSAPEVTIRTAVWWRGPKRGVFVSPVDSELAQWKTEQTQFETAGVRLALVLNGADEWAARWLRNR